MSENVPVLLFCFRCRKLIKNCKFCPECGDKLHEPHSYQQKKEATDILIELTESKIDWCKNRHPSETKNNLCPDCIEEYINFYKMIKKIQNIGEAVETNHNNDEINNLNIEIFKKEPLDKI
jgi:hypothetical protein